MPILIYIIIKPEIGFPEERGKSVKKNFIKKSVAGILSAILLGLFGVAGYYSSHLPDSVTTETGAVHFGAYPKLTADYISEDKAAVSLMGAIPVKSVTVNCEEAPTLIAGGNPFGIKLLMEGVMVTGVGEVDGKSSPAEDAGIMLGDVITHADDTPLSSNTDLQRIISESGGKDIDLDINRSGEHMTAVLKPVYSEKSEAYKGGMWVRDSIAGIGTMTFIDTATGRFAGLGHPVCDSDTGEMIPIQSGEAVPVKITEARKGEPSRPGELHGQFSGSDVYGTLNMNIGCGVFGTLTEKASEKFADSGTAYKMGYRQDIQIGSAYILSTVSGKSPKKYEVQIEAVDYNSRELSKNMIIRITDEELIKSTGGIVQGMSGSPIIQNDRLIGAVTHVFVADPTRGYGVFAENMYNSME
ncbi:MAG: SpoIVB peptidase [Ruminococcus sp.]|nr:SpoIVB peptidase [Ruminococcus sp.]